MINYKKYETNGILVVLFTVVYFYLLSRTRILSLSGGFIILFILPIILGFITSFFISKYFELEKNNWFNKSGKILSKEDSTHYKRLSAFFIISGLLVFAFTFLSNIIEKLEMASIVFLPMLLTFSFILLGIGLSYLFIHTRSKK